MNILFAYKNWLNPNRGGVGRVADTLARYFVDNGNRVYYLNHEYDKEDNYVFPAKIYTLPDTDFFSDRNLRYYQSLLRKLCIDIIVNHDASNHRSPFWLNTGLYPAKKISFYHTDPLHGLSRDIGYGKLANYILSKLRAVKYRIAMQSLLKHSDKLVVLSGEFKRNLQKNLMLNTSRIVPISNPCVFRKPQPLKAKKKQILFVGRLDWTSKRPDKMLRIWSSLFRQHPDWELLILGDGPDRQKTEKLARELELNNIVFKGFVDPEPYYKQAAVICLTSDYEGFGLAMAEAMQFGVVPVAFNNWTSITDIVIHEENGLVAKSNDGHDFTIKLNRLMSNEKDRMRMALNAIEHVQRFHINVIGPQWMALLNSCLNND
ncbi:Glycosyltransferase involved in cell wall bisynthesis [Saccharicrinis carchari]|uniref:Glycosyltransferase involved in cell wall bisynthesis n=1 Tax=Saccharicrinis carchari TaxID=1168039 RepID=A0A521BSI2_SACCC|nr:glycosyltransferase [Saccharicrinis carchari]SMO50015.1 Glycosyltransferase involved in cell wall bisynthesis [Saccharicrinis carchari]